MAVGVAEMLAAQVVNRAITLAGQLMKDRDDRLPADTDSEGELEDASLLEEDERDADGPDKILDAETVARGLSDLGQCADGTRPAFLTLSLAAAGVSNIGLLERYKHLQVVDLSRNSLTDISALGALQHLLVLNVSHNKLAKLLDFRPPHNLQSVDFSHNGVTQIGQQLQAHRALTRLILDHNQIKQLSGLENCALLGHLSASHNRLKLTTGLETLRRVRHLDLSDNSIRQVQGMQSLTSLNTLDLSNNRVETMLGLQHLRDLRSLSLRGNAIVDIAETDFVKGLKLLSSFDLRINPVQALPDFRLNMMYRLPCLLNLDGQPVSVEEKVDSSNLCDPPPSVVAAMNHTMHLSRVVLNPANLQPSTSASFSRPYPLLVLVGARGSGKRELRQSLLQKMEGDFVACISHTTRPAQAGEVDGVDYHFLTRSDMEAQVLAGNFLQTAQVGDYIYGLTSSEAERVAKSRRIGILCLEFEGLATLLKTSLEPVCVFVAAKNAVDDQDPTTQQRAQHYRRFLDEARARVQYMVEGTVPECLEQVCTAALPHVYRVRDRCFKSTTGAFL